MLRDQRLIILVVLLFLLFGLLLGLLLARQSGPNQYAQLGEGLSRRADDNRAVRGFKYVADSHSGLYWPNEDKYVTRIPAANRVWIKDDEMLDQFKSYKPGPR
jgi:hypothetical protein